MARQLIRVEFSTTTRPADATQYSIGDEIANSATAGSVVRATYTLDGFRRARVLSLSCSIVPASGNVVITALDFSAYLMKHADAIAAVGDNVALVLTSAYRAKAGKFSFLNTAWTQDTGALTAGATGFQKVLPAVTTSNGYQFEFRGGESRALDLVLQADAAWNPTAVVNTLNFSAELEVEP